MKPLIITIERKCSGGTVEITEEDLREAIDRAYGEGFEDGKRETPISGPIYPLYPQIPKSPLDGGISWTCTNNKGGPAPL